MEGLSPFKFQLVHDGVMYKTLLLFPHQSTLGSVLGLLVVWEGVLHVSICSLEESSCTFNTNTGFSGKQDSFSIGFWRNKNVTERESSLQSGLGPLGTEPRKWEWSSIIPAQCPLPLTLRSVPSHCAHTDVCALGQGHSLRGSYTLL